MHSIVDSRAATARRASLASPLQAAIGSFFGGPIAFAWFIRGNYIALGDRAAARKILALCALALLASNAALMLAIFVPASIALNTALGTMPFVLMVVAHGIAQRQLETAASGAVIRSSGNVVVCVVLSFVATAVCAAAAIVLALAIVLGTSGFR